MTKKIGKGDIMVVLQEILHKNAISTQEEIRESLSKKGFVVNQTKISRMLHKLGVAKMVENGETVYRLQPERVPITPRDMLKSVIVSIQHNESLIVIKTTPGSAQLVASLLDHKSDLNILGTVAGDDTIFVSPETTKKIQTVYNKVYKLLLEFSI